MTYSETPYFPHPHRICDFLIHDDLILLLDKAKSRLKLRTMKPIVLVATAVMTIILTCGMIAAVVYDATVMNEVKCQLRRDGLPPQQSSSQAATTPPKQQSLFQSIAPLHFPIDPDTGKIRLPPQVTTLAIDVGARESDYLTALEQTADETVVLILFDPLPVSFLPLQRRVITYSLTHADRTGLDKSRQDRVFAIHAALGDTEGTAAFNIAAGPACGGLLSTTENDAERRACAKAAEQKTVMVFTLKDVLNIIPDDENDNLISIHIKIDGEGADLTVLRGAGAAIQRASSVIIECQNLEANDPRILRKGSCLHNEAADYMCKEHGFCQSKFELSGPKNMIGNVFFTSEKDVDVPSFYRQGSIQFNKFYNSLWRNQKTWFQAS